MTVTVQQARPSTAARRAVLFGTPVVTGVLLLFHPPDPTAAMQLVDASGRWLAVHIGLLLLLPLLAVTLWLLVDGLAGPAATVSRLAVAAFAAFYAAFDALVGIGTGILVREAFLREGSEQQALAALAETWWSSPWPIRVFSIAGPLAWLIATVAAALAHQRAGSGPVVVAGLALAGPLFGFGHPYLTGQLAMAGLLVAAVALERHRRRPPTYHRGP
jgi:hypothetical protein